LQQPSQVVKKSAEKKGKPLPPPAKPQQFAPPPVGFGAELFAKVKARNKDEPKGLPRSPLAPNLGAVAKPGRLQIPKGGANLFDAIRAMKKDHTPSDAPVEQQVIATDVDSLAARTLKIPTPPPLPASDHRKRHSETDASQLEVVEEAHNAPPLNPSAFQTPAPNMKQLMNTRRTAMRGTHSSLGSMGNRSYHSDDDEIPNPAEALDFETEDLPPPADGNQLPVVPTDDEVRRAERLLALDLMPAAPLFSSQEFRDQLTGFQLRKTESRDATKLAPPQTERPAHRRAKEQPKTQGSDGFTDDEEDETDGSDSDVDPTQRAALMAQLAQKFFGAHRRPPN
jgi:hypothetical protein